MGLWRGTAWLGSSAGRQQVEVRANTYSGAVEQVKRIYGGERICTKLMNLVVLQQV